MPQYFPVYMDVAHRICIVVGGGEVALRKVRALLECQAAVTVVSPAVCPGLAEFAKKGAVTLALRDYQTGDLKGASLAIAATDNRDTNLRVSREAKEIHVPVNVVDEPTSSDFIVPSYFDRGALTIAVSTSGRSPALARKIRTMLEKEFGEEYAVLVKLVGEVRSEKKRLGYVVEAELWQAALDIEPMLALIRKGDEAGARRLLSGNLETPKAGK